MPRRSMCQKKSLNASVSERAANEKSVTVSQATTVRIEVRRPGKKQRWRKLADVKTTGTGVFSARATHRKGQRYRVKWTSPSGKRYSGAAVRSY